MTKSNPATTAPSATPRVIRVREIPIELCQFLKFGGITESGGAAKQAISEGLVLLNGMVETRKHKKLVTGDRITFAGETLEVQVS